MDDAISREQAIKATWQDTGYTDPFNVMTAIRDRIKQLPPIQPKRGRWINGNCSECNEHAPYWCMASTYHASNFCPNCGADMREVTT